MDGRGDRGRARERRVSCEGGRPGRALPGVLPRAPVAGCPGQRRGAAGGRGRHRRPRRPHHRVWHLRPQPGAGGLRGVAVVRGCGRLRPGAARRAEHRGHAAGRRAALGPARCTRACAGSGGRPRSRGCGLEYRGAGSRGRRGRLSHGDVGPGRALRGPRGRARDRRGRRGWRAALGLRRRRASRRRRRARRRCPLGCRPAGRVQAPRQSAGAARPPASGRLPRAARGRAVRAPGGRRPPERRPAAARRAGPRRRGPLAR